MIFRKLLGTKLVALALLGEHAQDMMGETLLLDRDYLEFLKKNKVS